MDTLDETLRRVKKFGEGWTGLLFSLVSSRLLLSTDGTTVVSFGLPRQDPERRDMSKVRYGIRRLYVGSGQSEENF